MIVEIRTYRLTPDSAEAFVEVMRSRAVPLLADQRIRVLACGLSVAADGEPQPDAYLIRTFASAAERTRQEDAFYGSQAWIAGPRDDVVSRIVDFHTVVLEASPEAVRSFAALDRRV